MTWTRPRRLASTLIRCRVLAAKIANELRNKRPEHFVDKLPLADIHTSLERAADVLTTVKGSQARGRQRHWIIEGNFRLPTPLASKRGLPFTGTWFGRS
jgi:hypothetical protein